MARQKDDIHKTEGSNADLARSVITYHHHHRQLRRTPRSRPLLSSPPRVQVRWPADHLSSRMQATASERLVPINPCFSCLFGHTVRVGHAKGRGISPSPTFSFLFSFCGRERQQPNVPSRAPRLRSSSVGRQSMSTSFCRAPINGPGLESLGVSVSNLQYEIGGRREGRRGEEPCVGGKRGRERSRCLTCWRPGTRTCMYVWSMPGHVDGHGGSEAGISAAGAPSSWRVGPVRRCETRFSATRARRRVQYIPKRERVGQQHLGYLQ